jgi:hypothetical protein
MNAAGRGNVFPALLRLVRRERTAGANFPEHSRIMGLSTKNVTTTSVSWQYLSDPGIATGKPREGSRK